MEIDGRENFSDMENDSPMSNTSHHTEEDDKESECESQMTAASYLEESPPHDQDAYAVQQRELLERLKDQYSIYPFGVNGFPGMNLTGEQIKRLQPDAQNEFPFSFPTPPPSKDEMKISPNTKKSSSSSQSSNTWSYEDQFKQVRQLYEINDDPKRKDFLDELFMFMKDRGTPINRLPIMAKSVLDLYELYKLVIQRGGLVNVINKKLWQEIIKDLNLPSSITSAAFTLRTQYTKYLYPFESEKFNLSSDTELQAAIENNKRDGSRRSTSTYSQFTPQSSQQQQLHQQQLQQQQQQLQQQQLQQQQLQQQLALLTALGVNNPLNMNLNLNLNNENNEDDEPLTSQQLEIQAAQQRFMMMMMLYNQFMQAQSTT